ncbi:hypothetical protein EXU48_06710 [Occultella glacieicola]|uniref:Uncharacterized protein n=1 Tax=Occultella glacieicola TaxID=2518684 RepID=A0ABY2E7A9_9MICO|nr:hypothetical protein [Occultella glacieicola]TDE95938.1 hypothetical protein EXU48_06710 [Occultella glacieicola]
MAALTGAAALALAGCTDGGGSEPPDEPTQEITTDEPTEAPTPEEPTADPHAIASVDLGAMTWTLDPSPLSWPLNPPAEVELADGTGTVEGWTYELREVVYADADGDGDDDALAALFVMTGNETATQYYAWEWDEGAEQAVQLVDVVAQSGACRDAVSVVEPADSGFAISETLTASENVVDCVDGGATHDRTRVVGIADGAPVRVDGPGGWGGTCGFPASEILRDADAGQQAPSGVSAAPGGAVAAESGDLTGLAVLGASPSGGDPIVRDGWNQVGYAVEGSPDSDQLRIWLCGWVQFDGP